MEPLCARTEGVTRARMFLSILGCSMMGMIAHRCEPSYAETERILSGIREAVYSNGSHTSVELTKGERWSMRYRAFCLNGIMRAI